MSTAQMTVLHNPLLTIRRDELRQWKDEREQLQQEVIRLRSHIIKPSWISLPAPASTLLSRHLNPIPL